MIKSKYLNWLILFVLPFFIYVGDAFYHTNLWDLLFIWPLCFLSGILIIKIKKDKLKGSILYLLYAIIYTLILFVIYHIIYFKLGGGIP